MRHPTLAAVKIGIAGTGIAYNRIADHQRHGWDAPSYVHPCNTGEHAAQIEREVKLALRTRFGDRGYVTREQMPQGGWTETYPETSLSTEQLRDLVDAAARSVPSRSTQPTPPVQDLPSAAPARELLVHEGIGGVPTYGLPHA